MGTIPYTSNVDARSLRSSNVTIDSGATPDAYGAGIGRATQQLGQAVGQVADVVGDMAKQEYKRKQEETAANERGKNDFTPLLEGIKQGVGADAKGYHDTVVTKYQDWVTQTADAITDDHARKLYRQQQMEMLPSIASQAAEYEARAGEAYSKDEANAGLNGVQNKINSDPANYDAYLQQGNDIIAARPGINAAVKADMQRTFGYDSAKRRFEGMLLRAKTVPELDSMAQEMVGKDGNSPWTGKMLPNDYEKLLNDIGDRRKTLQTAINSNAKSALTNTEERAKADPLALIPADELRSVQEGVRSVSDAETAIKAARLMRDQEIVRTERTLPVPELRARVNAVNGNPGMAYPNLPPEVSDAVNSASQKFGISASYLGGTATREYGQYFKQPKIKVDETFKPQALGAGIDLRNYRADVVDGLTMAGQQLGKPLTLVKGNVAPGSAQGASINVPTVGMTQEDKAKLVGALVDNGFTGIAENANDIGADVRQAVPKNFGPDKTGKVWGGWTFLSPEITKVLEEKGYAAGAESSILKRNPAAKPTTGIDYGKGTAILGEDGKPTSSSTGVMQFNKDTFLQIMKSNGPAIGVDTSKMSDDDILKLRGDPKVSILAGAALAAQNKKTLESTLGRPVNDAELYMAHFMGPGGATAFLNAYKNSPDQSAAQLLPSAAKANPPVFMDGKRPRSVQEVYNNIAQSFTIDPSKIAFDDNEMRKRMIDRSEAELKDDPITHATKVGTHVITPLDESGDWTARGREAEAVADYNTIPRSEMKPFTQDEANYFKKQIDEGNVEKNMQIMSSMLTLGPTMGKAALKQIGEKDAVFAQAAGLYGAGHADIARTIMQGQKKLLENPKLKEQVGDKGTQISDAFVSQTGGALSALKPADREATQNAAMAYYIQRVSNQGKLNSWDDGAYNEAVNAVLGGTKDVPALGKVNDNTVLMPGGIREETFQNAISRMGVDDWTRMSDKGQPPYYSNGMVAHPDDINDNIALKAIGGGKYQLTLEDGAFLLNKDGTPYTFTPDVKSMENIAAKPTARGHAGSFRNPFGMYP